MILNKKSLDVQYYSYRSVRIFFSGKRSTGQFLSMLNDVLDAEIKKLGEDKVIKQIAF